MNMQTLFHVPLIAMAALCAMACAHAASPFPLQVELRVACEPTAFPSAGQTHLLYELQLTNFSGDKIDLRRIEVLDAATPNGNALASFDGEQIDSLLQAKGREIAPSTTQLAYMHVALDAKARVPDKVMHRVLTDTAAVEGAVIRTHHNKLKTLTPPVQGGTWHAYDGPSNHRENHHRRGLFVADGRASISRRFATDWFLMQDDETSKGDPRDARSYYSYAQPVFAVADGTVVTARDGLPDNVPGPVEVFRPTLPVAMETIAGNMIVLDLGDGQFASYFHLQRDSLRVKAGDRVRSGQELGRIGVSGDSNLPHLHFEVTTSPNVLTGEGVPYVIDHFRVWTDRIWQQHSRELPMRDMLVEFGRAHRNSD